MNGSNRFTLLSSSLLALIVTNFHPGPFAWGTATAPAEPPAVGQKSAQPKAPRFDAQLANQLLLPPHAREIKITATLTITPDGKLQADRKHWTLEKDPDGTDLYTAKGSVSSRVAAVKSNNGHLELLTSFVLKDVGPGSGNSPPEEATSLFFAQGQLAALTSCEDTGEKSSVGRVCVTATPKLCQSLKNGGGLDADTLQETEKFEMRSLATLLTLRGSDHQLENVLRSGNRLGLKTALQTTKGQLVTLAKQIEKEQAAAKAPASAQAPDKAQIEQSLLAKSVLEKSLPRLKQACLDTKF
jgi:hypothetical protein